MIKLAIVDDQNLFREGLKSLLETNENIRVVFAAENGEEALRKIEESAPSVVLLDISMPGMDGFELCKRITAHFPEVKILMLSGHEKQSYVNQAIQSGAHGYLDKTEQIDEIIHAIEDVHYKGYYFNRWVSMDILQGFVRDRKPRSHLKDRVLSSREIEVIRLICQEKTDREIGEIMHISPRTVETYRKNIMKKIGVKKSIGIAIYAIENRYLI